LKMQLLQFLIYTGIAVLGFTLLSLGVGFSVYIAKRHPVHAEATANVWTSESKLQAIKAARWRERKRREQELRELEQREQELREQELHQQEIDSQKRLHEPFGVPIGSNGHEDSDELFSDSLSPLWVYN